jgi:hypothetical protein
MTVLRLLRGAARLLDIGCDVFRDVGCQRAIRLPAGDW